jgi:hypothetical protein
MAQKGGAKDISSRVLLVIDHQESERGTTEVRVIEWSVGGAQGVKTYINLEKRELYTADDGQERMGKAKGFNKKDWLLLASPTVMARVSGIFGVNGSAPKAATPPPAEMAETVGGEQDF